MDRQPTPHNLEPIIRNAITNGASLYAQGCESRVDDFVQRHFSLTGSLKIHSHALGWDLLRVPVNILWSTIALLLAGVGFLLGLLGLSTVKQWLQRVPAGLVTDMDRQISWLVVTELLQLPYAYRGKRSDKDALMEAIVKDPCLHLVLTQTLADIEASFHSDEFQDRLQSKLAEYGATRTGSADLASNAVLLISSKLAMGQASFGALSAGTAASTAVAHALAVSNFWLGSTLGAYYYALVPVTVSLPMLVGVTAIIVIVLAFVSTFIGVVSDPLQVKLGFHQRRLKKLIAALQNDLQGGDEYRFHLREKYMGRLFDVVDVLATVGR